MIAIYFSRLFSLIISFSLLTGSLYLSPISDSLAFNIPDLANNNSEMSYVYFGNDRSNIAEVIATISGLEKKEDSSLYILNKQIEEGFLLAELPDVIKAIEYAQLVIERKRNILDAEFIEKISYNLVDVMNQIENESLIVNGNDLNHYRKNCCNTPTNHHCNSHINHKRKDLIINENIKVLGKSFFCKYIKTKHGIHIGGNLTVDKDATFEGDVFVEGALSAGDAAIGSLSITDLVVASCIDSLCVTTLSVTDLVVGGSSCIDSLCINNLTVDNITGNTLSFTDGFIENLTFNSSVLDSIINNLTVNVMLSANDAVINGNLQFPNFTPAGILHNDALGNISSSLIINADIDPLAAIADSKLATISTVGKVANSATTATSINVPNTIVLRDGSGNFAAGTITANLNGNATTATSTVNFTGVLAGEVTGTQGATVVSNAVSANTANAIVRRTATGGFSAGVISMTDGIATGNINLTTEPSSSTAGIIQKNGARFIHDFGTNNTFVGINAGNFTMAGSGNLAFGPAALGNVTTGNNNIALGSSANFITTGSNNIYLGANGTANESNVIRIGTGSAQCFISGIQGQTIGASAGVLINASGRLGTQVSSHRFKHNIVDMSDISENIYKLNPVEFAYNADPSEAIQFGLIAEDVSAAFPELVMYDTEGKPYSVQYHFLPVLLLNEVKKQQATINSLKITIETMNEAISSLQILVNQYKQHSTSTQN